MLSQRQPYDNRNGVKLSKNDTESTKMNCIQRIYADEAVDTKLVLSNSSEKNIIIHLFKYIIKLYIISTQKNIESHENTVLMAFCHNSIRLSATAPVLPVELRMIFTIDTFTDLPHHISISIVHGIFTIRMKKVGRHQNSGKLLVLLQTA